MNLTNDEQLDWETIEDEITEEQGKEAFEKDRNYFTKEFNWFRERKAISLLKEVVFRWRSEMKDARNNENRDSIFNPMGYLTTMIKEIKNDMPDSTSSLMRVEGNLIEYPYFRFGKRSSEPIVFKTERVNEITKNKVSINWEAKTTSLIPNEDDKDVLMALIKIWQDSGKKPDGIVYFTKAQVAKLLKRPYSGQTCAHIEKAVEHFFNLNITSEEAFILFKESAKIFVNNLGEKSGIKILTHYKFYVPGEGANETDELFKSEATFSHQIIHNLLLFYAAEIDWDFYVSLRLGVSKRIYEILQKRRGSDQKTTWASNLFLFASRVGISTKTPRNIKPALSKALIELQETGYLKKYEVEKKENEEVIRFYF